MKINNRKELFICDCHDAEHQFILSWFPDDRPYERMLYLQIHLINYDNVFKRIWAGIRYILGHHCRYGHWDEVLINDAEADRLQGFIREYLGGSNVS